MRGTSLAVLLACILMFVSAATGHAEDQISAPEQQSGSQTLRYVYDAGYGTVFTMYIRGKNITISSSFPRASDNFRIIDMFREGNKQFLKLAEGAVLTVDNDKLLWNNAVYVRQNNLTYYRRIVTTQ